MSDKRKFKVSFQMIKPLVAGNWKMNGTIAGLDEVKAIVSGAKGLKCDVLICPPFTLLSRFAGQGVAIGAQDCHEKVSGAYTGNISADMLKEIGVSAVIVGHSERRQYHLESDALVQAKAKAAWSAGLVAIICLGETKEERVGGVTLERIATQLAGSVPEGARAQNTVIAYEPVWAIGTGLTPTAQDVAQVHSFMREALVQRFGQEGAAMRLLYGGSVKGENAQELMGIPHVNGALVGGASLKAKDFLAIAGVYA
jgi:triosephosphate isomerase (TIM)